MSYLYSASDSQGQGVRPPAARGEGQPPGPPAHTVGAASAPASSRRSKAQRALAQRPPAPADSFIPFSLSRLRPPGSGKARHTWHFFV